MSCRPGESRFSGLCSPDRYNFGDCMRFLKLVSVSETIEVLRSLAVRLPEEMVPLDEAYGRVLSRSVECPQDIPGFTRSVKDGFAVRAMDTLGAAEQKPVLLRLTGRVLMGESDAGSVGERTTKYIPTGGVLPEGADAVVMQENAEVVDDVVMVKGPVNPGADVLGYDDDFSAGEVVFPAGFRVTAQATGVLAAFGVDPVPVRVRPKVGIISTGNELVRPRERVRPGQIRDANSSMLRAFFVEQGAVPVFYGIVRDDADALSPVLLQAAAECDLVMISGGSSKDERDVTAGVVAALGSVHIHGVSVAPGKPTIVGTVADTLVIGLPGQPASAFVITTLFAGEVLRAMTGELHRVRTVSAPLSMSFPSEKGREDLVRARVLADGRVEPVLGKSGLLNTLIRSDGYLRIPSGLDGCEEGDVVEVFLWE